MLAEAGRIALRIARVMVTSAATLLVAVPIAQRSEVSDGCGGATLKQLKELAMGIGIGIGILRNNHLLGTPGSNEERLDPDF
ncbi:hypothetical protein [Curtobacterium flaccumfaciens]|uniref:hypothetical protein n=1 Tax=Curtobacterium flaccumfaciens TaxID=2035 RepID=UPI001BDFCE6B|nr:hypothetical protein [Curtobacterium flaccumfaciens]MBT1585763.1 hypothetical protein [Curtobacterium flaccumfaciens pv. flaccumfaciens]MCX2797435.1 hypothetical protein [Curtobacterium flaccumfaciens pv. flaccumfaciens]